MNELERVLEGLQEEVTPFLAWPIHRWLRNRSRLPYPDSLLLHAILRTLTAYVAALRWGSSGERATWADLGGLAEFRGTVRRLLGGGWTATVPEPVRGALDALAAVIDDAWEHRNRTIGHVRGGAASADAHVRLLEAALPLLQLRVWVAGRPDGIGDDDEYEFIEVRGTGAPSIRVEIGLVEPSRFPRPGRAYLAVRKTAQEVSLLDLSPLVYVVDMHGLEHVALRAPIGDELTKSGVMGICACCEHDDPVLHEPRWPEVAKVGREPAFPWPGSRPLVLRRAPVAPPTVRARVREAGWELDGEEPIARGAASTVVGARRAPDADPIPGVPHEQVMVLKVYDGRRTGLGDHHARCWNGSRRSEAQGSCGTTPRRVGSMPPPSWSWTGSRVSRSTDGSRGRSTRMCGKEWSTRS
jgi:hypothetical protein